MAIKYLKGIYGDTKPKTTRPPEFQFPLGVNFSVEGLETANSANTATTETIDVLVVAGGGPGGPGVGTIAVAGGGGAGGVRIFSSNSITDIVEYKNPLNIASTVNFIPVTVGAAGGNSCLGASIINCRGGAGGYWRGGPGGQPGGSGSAQGCYPNFIPGPIGCGIFGQGCNGGTNGGAALANSCTSGGLTSVITGTNVSYGNGGCRSTGPVVPNCNTPNRGNGSVGNHWPPGPAGNLSRSGDSGQVVVRYRNPAAPTTPLATGGDCICCTGGCIIHIFDSSGFLNVAAEFNIN
jgi:hypothetical protein